MLLFPPPLFNGAAEVHVFASPLCCVCNVCFRGAFLKRS